MKKFRKLFAVLTASALVGAMSFTTMAASIKINHDDTYDGTAAQKYQAYKILDVIKDDSTKGNATDDTVGKPSSTSGIAYSMASNSEWVPALTAKEQEWLNYSLSADGSKYFITLKTEKEGVDNNEATAKAMANYFNAYKDAHNIDATVKDITADQPGTPVQDGYYLITSTLGTNLILATSDIEITEKNDYPKDDKKVETASITAGQNATYYITVVVPKSIDTSKKITVHDKLSNALSFNDESVKVYSVDTTGELNASTPVTTLKGFNYGELAEGITVITGLDDGCAFHIEIDPKDHKEEYAGKTLVFKYTATLKDEAAADTGFVNREFLDYSGYTTTNKDVPVMTYDFDLEKTFKNSTNEQTELKATFNLYTAEEYVKLTDNSSETTAKAMKFKKDSDNQNHYYVSSSGNEGIEAAKGNRVNVRGLGEGTYYLVETDTAKGYNVLDHAIKIKVTPNYKDGKVTHSEAEAENTEVMITNGTDAKGNPKTTYNFVSVENVKGLLLPSTGGMGTTVFAIVGLLVMAGAAVTLIVKKRA